MSQRMVKCAKLGRELPGIDEATPEGRKALKMALLLGGPEAKRRIHDAVSMEAWKQWKDHMIMVMNEFRLDATSDASNAILNEHMQAFFFGTAHQIPGYKPKDA
jgi:Fe-S cluster biosynthesis and repair protein YggX